MRQQKQFELHFSKQIPSDLTPGVLYISMDYGTVIHLCACGCNEKVITPLSPSDWQLSYDGETVSLRPSIGNYSFSCRSHYWIRNSKVVWAERLDSPLGSPLLTSQDKKHSFGARIALPFKTLWNFISRPFSK